MFYLKRLASVQRYYRALNITSILIFSSLCIVFFRDSFRCDRVRNKRNFWIFNLDQFSLAVVLDEFNYLISQTSFFFNWDWIQSRSGLQLIRPHNQLGTVMFFLEFISVFRIYMNLEVWDEFGFLLTISNLCLWDWSGCASLNWVWFFSISTLVFFASIYPNMQVSSEFDYSIDRF